MDKQHMINQLKRHAEVLLECVKNVEEDQVFNQEMKDWDITIQDGLEDKLNMA